MEQNVFEIYEHKFHEPWPKLIPQNEDFVKHCLDLDKSIDDLPDDDPYVKKYFSGDIIY